jgi:cytochrome c-type biogenesis protein CcmH/NrfG
VGVPRTPRAATSPPTPRTRTLLKPGAPPPAGPATGRTPPPGVAVSRTTTPTHAVATGRTPTPRAAPPASRTPTPTRLPRTRSPGTESVDSAAAAALDPIAAARDAYKRGQSRLRVENLEDAIADLARAVELAPHEVDYAATLAWARFCHAADKPALAHATREALGRAIRTSPSPVMARFYLGRVERMLGRDKEALRHFQEVLQAQPRHADAAAEVRAIEARAAQAAARESGVFGRKR